MGTLRENWHKKIHYGSLYYPLTKYVGKVYGGGVNGEIVTSIDGWETIHSIKNIGVSEEITSINFLSGTMIIGTYSGNIYRSPSPYTTFTKVLDMEGTKAWPLTWSVTGNASIIFVAEYGDKGSDPAANGRRVYKSTDNGLTWVKCWTTPFETGSHIHKIIVDQYTNDLYVCTGDGTTYARLFKLSPPNYDTETVLVSGIQPTGGIVFADYNLWVQDIQPYGIYKHNKSTNAIELVLDLVNDFSGYNDTGFDGLILAPNGTTVYYGTHPSTFQTTQKCGIFKAEPPYTEWALIASIDEFTNAGTTSNGIRHFYDVSDIALHGQFTWMPIPYGVRRQRGIDIVHFSQDLRT